MSGAPYVGADIVLKMDLRDFFSRTTLDRVRAYFVKIGWGGDAADLLVRLTTYQQGLPQGAPTSPRLSNLVNYGLDSRLFALGLTLGAMYTPTISRFPSGSMVTPAVFERRIPKHSNDSCRLWRRRMSGR